MGLLLNFFGFLPLSLSLISFLFGLHYGCISQVILDIRHMDSGNHHLYNGLSNHRSLLKIQDHFLDFDNLDYDLRNIGHLPTLNCQVILDSKVSRLP